jgi:hypothetical protein
MFVPLVDIVALLLLAIVPGQKLPNLMASRQYFSSGSESWLKQPVRKTDAKAWCRAVIATRKMRWPLLAASCLMEFIWFSQGMSL